MRRVLTILLVGIPLGCAGQSTNAMPPPGVSLPPPASASAIASASVGKPDVKLPPIDAELVRTMAITRNFRLGTPKSATPTPDGKSVLFLRSPARDPKQSLYELDVASQNVKELLSPATVAKGPEVLSAAEKARRERLRITTSGFTAFEMSGDGARVVVTLSGRLVVVERATGKWKEIDTGDGSVIDPHLSHDGKRIAFVRNDDLFTVEIDANKPTVTAITKGGTEAKSHGTAEFIAQEELDRSRGFWWSPDDAKFLYQESDVSKVERLSIVDPAHPEKAPDRPYYPRAGKTNADVRFGVVSAKGGVTTWIAWDRTKYPYVAHVEWSKNGPPTLYVMDRLQQNALLLAVDVASGKTQTLLEEHDPAWLNIDPEMPRWLDDGRFLWTTERTGKWKLELHEKTGKHVSTMLPPDLGYDGFLDADPVRGVAFVNASKDPTESQVWSIDLKTGEPTQTAVGTVIVGGRFAKSHAVFTTYENGMSGERHYRVRKATDGTVLAEIPSVAEVPSSLRPIEIVRLTTDDLRVAIVRPKSFDKTRKYPVIDAAYAGPHVSVVTADAFQYARSAWIADATGSIVVSIDAKGTPHRGRDFERVLKNAFASVPLDGHVSALRALGERFPEMDLAHVGVFGWSFGGYYSALAVLKKPDVYRVAVSGAPVNDWRDYDTAYTERYLGLPEEAPGGVYDQNAVQSYAKKPAPGDPIRALLIAHGTADDNVFFLHSLKLVDALTRAGRPFEFMPIAGSTHLLAEPAMAEAFWARAAAFLRDRLHE